MSEFSNPASGAKEAAEQYTKAILSLLGDQNAMAVLEELPEFVDSLVAGLSEPQLRLPEAEGKWSVVEVLQHLADSELVWGYRLRMIVAHDRPEITGYDQDLWADRLHYQQVAAADAIAQLRVLRQTNLNFLKSLSPADLRRVGYHVERGEESVERMIPLYAGHDLAHRRQLLRIKSKLG